MTASRLTRVVYLATQEDGLRLVDTGPSVPTVNRPLLG
jgi:hypothetical protein